MTDRELMQQALEALKKCRYRSLADEIVDPAITALTERLAQPEQEPVASIGSLNEFSAMELVRRGFALTDHLYTAPPQRKPLTDEQRKDLIYKAFSKWMNMKDDGNLFAWHFSFEVEAAHGIEENA